MRNSGAYLNICFSPKFRQENISTDSSSFHKCVFQDFKQTTTCQKGKSVDEHYLESHISQNCWKSISCSCVPPMVIKPDIIITPSTKYKKPPPCWNSMWVSCYCFGFEAGLHAVWAYCKLHVQLRKSLNYRSSCNSIYWIELLLFPEWWGHRCVSPHLVYMVLRSELSTFCTWDKDSTNWTTLPLSGEIFFLILGLQYNHNIYPPNLPIYLVLLCSLSNSWLLLN